MAEEQVLDTEPQVEEPTDDQAPAADDAAEPKTEPKTALDDDSDSDSGEVKGDWPDDWRTKAAKGNDKLVKQLERYKSPVDMASALLAAQQKIRSGDLTAALPEDASEEDVAAWRKDNGIPEKPEGYLDLMTSGVVIGDDDKPVVESFLQSAHAKNASPDVVASAIDWYYERQEEVAAQQAEADNAIMQKATDELRAEWGGEYRQNINAIKSFLTSAGTAEDGTNIGELLMGARLPDGTPFSSHPDVLRWLASTASAVNPGGFLAPGDAQTQLQAISGRKAEIEKMMRTNRREYNKDEAVQEEYRKILEAEERLESRTRAA